MTILIGMDVPEAHWKLEERRVRKKEPYAIRTPLGWSASDSINIDSIIEQVDNKILNLKKEFTVKICELNQQVSGLKANGMGSLSQDKSIDDLKREKQQLKDKNRYLSEKVMNL